MDRGELDAQLAARIAGFVAGATFARREVTYFAAEDRRTCACCGQEFWPTEGPNFRAINYVQVHYGAQAPRSLGGWDASGWGRRPAMCRRCAEAWMQRAERMDKEV
jgi:hypothetical protein